MLDPCSFLVRIGIATATCSIAWTQSPSDGSTVAERPNILVFLVDDLGWKDGGVLGSKFHETPHLDAMASTGMRFTQAYANAPNCAPSRASLITGLYTPRHGILTVGKSTRGKKALRKLVPIANKTELDRRFTTVAESLSDAGYSCGIIGKWHLDNDPTKHGFEFSLAANHSGAPRGGYFSPYRNPDIVDGPKGESLIDRLTDEAATFVRDRTDKPWFLLFSHYAVHTPIQAEEERAARFARRLADGNVGPGPHNAKYAAMVERTDQSLGRMLSLLDELELTENTLVVFLSDNGGYGPATSMHPLRGAKGMLFEGGIRIPMVFCWPGHIAAGTKANNPVAAHDLFPTLLGVAQAKVPANDGVDLLPLLTGEITSLPRRSLYWHFPVYLQAYKNLARPFRTRPAAAVRSGDLKLIEWFEEDPDSPTRFSLFDLSKDPSESRDLAADRKTDVARLHADMKSWRKRVGAEVPTRPNPAYDAAKDAAARGR